jgi:Lipid A 3-O-deacylase (PagL)
MSSMPNCFSQCPSVPIETFCQLRIRILSAGENISFWLSMLALLVLQSLSHAQSTPTFAFYSANSGGMHCIDSLPTGRPGRAIHRETCRLAPTACARLSDRLDPDFGPDSDWLRPEAARRDVPSGFEQAMSAIRNDGSAIGESGSNHGADSKPSSASIVQSQNPPPFDRSIYYRNRLEFAVDGGWLPINIPFVFDVFLGDAYNKTPLNYTLVPLVASLRWHIDDVEGPWIFRGNWDMTFSGSFTFIPRGPETHFISYDMGIRRNFVPHRGKIAPYFDGRLGLGEINAKAPLGVLFAQGQNFTFTVNMGSGVRYNFNPRYSASAGLSWMHISNLYLSEPAFANYGINVYGPTFGIDIRLGKPRRDSH